MSPLRVHVDRSLTTIRRHGVAVLAIGVSALYLVTACSGGEESLDEVLSGVTEAELPLMVLPAEEIGELAQGFVVTADDAGAVSHEEAAEDTTDPDDTAQDLIEAGRIAGYELFYGREDQIDFEGLVGVGTSVELWDSADAAAASIEREVEAIRAYDGQPLDGLVLTRLTDRSLEGVGDQAGLLRLRTEVVGFSRAFTISIVYLRLGPIVATAAAVDDGELPAAEVESLAARLVERIEAIARGELVATPVPVPTATEATVMTEPPAGTPDISGRAIQLDDLPQGMTLDEAGFEADDDALVVYSVSYDGAVAYGDTLVSSLSNEVSLFPTETAARLFFEATTAIWASDTSIQVWEDAFRTAGGESAFTNIETAEGSLDVGDDSRIFQFSGDGPIGPMTVVIMMVRVGDSVSSITIVAPSSATALTDVLPLGVQVAERLTAPIP